MIKKKTSTQLKYKVFPANEQIPLLLIGRKGILRAARGAETLQSERPPPRRPPPPPAPPPLAHPPAGRPAI